MAARSRLVIIIEYNGSRYHGFQLQKNAATVQGELESALYKLTGEKIRVESASRTDAGVHARDQVASFKTNSDLLRETFVGGLNYYLPPDIAVKAAYRVENNLNIRKEAISREYHYYILNRRVRSPLKADYSWHFKGELDIAEMNEASRMLCGKHNFIGFASALQGKELLATNREVLNAEWVSDKELRMFRIVANSFLRHQVRNTVGSLVRVGQGKMSLAEFADILNEKKMGIAGPAAPACGLCLIKVNYPYSFEGKTDENL